MFALRPKAATFYDEKPFLKWSHSVYDNFPGYKWGKCHQISYTLDQFHDYGLASAL